METGASAPRVAVAGAYAGGRTGPGRTQRGPRSWRVILQATVAASPAYAAGEAIGHETPFFAPIAAIATVAISLAQRLRRAAELLLGNAIGILLADLLVIRIGTGAWQVGLVVAIALTTALLAGGGPILIMQASSSAILIATIAPPTPDQPWNTGRFADALIGGGIGLAVSALLMPVDPARHVRSATDPLLAALHDGYRRVGLALRAGDQAGAEDVLAYLRGHRAGARRLPCRPRRHAGVRASGPLVLGPAHAAGGSYALAGVHLDNAIRNLRVLARQATMAIDRAEPVPADIPDALAILAEAVEVLGPVLAAEESPDAVRALLLDAVRRAVGAAGGDPIGIRSGTGIRSSGPGAAGLFNAPMIVAVRLSVSDLLQATGLSGTEAHALIRAAGDSPG